MYVYKRPPAIKVLCQLQGESEEKIAFPLMSKTFCICMHRSVQIKGIHNVYIKMQNVVPKAL